MGATSTHAAEIPRPNARGLGPPPSQLHASAPHAKEPRPAPGWDAAGATGTVWPARPRLPRAGAVCHDSFFFIIYKLYGRGVEALPRVHVSMPPVWQTAVCVTDLNSVPVAAAPAAGHGTYWHCNPSSIASEQLPAGCQVAGEARARGTRSSVGCNSARRSSARPVAAGPSVHSDSTLYCTRTCTHQELA